MSNGLAVWGAVTGTIGTLTGVGNLARTAVRDRRSQRRDLNITHGWQYAYDSENNLVDVWVCVTMRNTGNQPLHVEYVGFETLVLGDRKLADEAGLDLPPENNVWVNKRFEIALNTETLEVAPNGPPMKVWTRLVPMCVHGFDPTDTPFRAYGVTWQDGVETWWWEEHASPLLGRPSQVHRSMPELGEAVAHLVLNETDDEEWAPPYDLPGGVVALQRLMMDGSVQRVSELFPEPPREEPPSDTAPTSASDG